MEKMQQSQYHEELRKKFLKDSTLLMAVAERALADETICGILVDETDDPAVLDLMLVNSGKPEVQAKAASKTPNIALVEQLLADLTKGASSYNALVITACLRRTSDQLLIIKTFKNSTDPGVQIAALEQMTDSVAIDDIALNHPNSFYRRMAVKKTPTVNVLYQVVLKDKVDEVAFDAILRLDLDTLYKLRQELPSSNVLDEVNSRITFLQIKS